jgi:tRNA pseudouridine38-40 synthase
MRNVKLIIEYDGTNYHGWQSQINALTVQDVIQEAIKKLTGEQCSLIGSSRTDVGVHAMGQVANFHNTSTIPPERFSYALNSVLPDDIVIRKSEEVDTNFHSRYCAKGKKYRYLIYNCTQPSALMRNRAYHVPCKLDLQLMQQAALHFLGKHDFSSFRASGSSVKTSERTIHHVSVKKDENLISFEISGDGFLYNMVRIIAGTLVEVGRGRIAPDDIPSIICSRNRSKAGKTAPPQGLYLVEVYY